MSAVESWELKVEGGENDDASRVVPQGFAHPPYASRPPRVVPQELSPNRGLISNVSHKRKETKWKEEGVVYVRSL